MNTLFEILPLLVPVLLIDIALAVAAVRHVLRHPRYRFGNKRTATITSHMVLFPKR